MTRRRVRFIALALGTIVLGLFVHLHGAALDPVARDVLGDALWAAMLASWVGALAPLARGLVRGGLAYVACVAVEASQLYHAPALDAARSTRLGHLILGSGFDPRDLTAYALGVAAAVLLEAAVTARAGASTRGHQR